MADRASQAQNVTSHFVVIDEQKPLSAGERSQPAEFAEKDLAINGLLEENAGPFGKRKLRFVMHAANDRRQTGPFLPYLREEPPGLIILQINISDYRRRQMPSNSKPSARDS